MAEDWRRSAVLVPIFARAPHGMLFVERAAHLRRHPGQIGFPGGTDEPADAGDPVRTALRELFEELGVEAERVAVVGRLADLDQRMNRFIITPIVGVLDAATRVALDGEEIAGVFTVPLAAIVAPGAIYDDLETTQSRGRQMYAFDYEGRHVWGLTARILKAFVEAWTAPDSALRATAEALLR